jgi:hypothetical protein
MIISGAKINYLFLTFYRILDTTSYLEISSFGISKEFTPYLEISSLGISKEFTSYLEISSFEMPKDDISRYDVVSKMLSKNKEEEALRCKIGPTLY